MRAGWRRARRGRRRAGLRGEDGGGRGAETRTRPAGRGARRGGGGGPRPEGGGGDAGGAAGGGRRGDRQRRPAGGAGTAGAQDLARAAGCRGPVLITAKTSGVVEVSRLHRTRRSSCPTVMPG
ncbi:hypothetical protein DVA86_35115 [Streptomyces armeniacus]|uniref:Uncharacterized protein n=1 Tax=Streptomyces armeniacus TaxID=83291 RepID=A0A345XZ94_9ACTN|nr:hypothetical protein DVA86_35115 [Streptomyces armeniacus]